jgi:hypothetical protein
MAPEGLEHAISESERPQTHTLDRAATGIGSESHWPNNDKNVRIYFRVNVRATPLLLIHFAVSLASSFLLSALSLEAQVFRTLVIQRVRMFMSAFKSGDTPKQHFYIQV